MSHPAPKPPPPKDSDGSIRLKVSYKSASSLLNEFTRTVGKGSVALESKKKVKVGTRFVFEMHESGANTRIEVIGEVVSVTPLANGKHLLNIRYDPGGAREGLDGVLARIFEDQTKYEKMRKHPRVPINLRATEDAPYSPSFLVRDISGGGVGVEVESPTVPKAVALASPFLLEIWLSIGTLSLHGEIAWLAAQTSDGSKWMNPVFGVKFGKLRPESAEHLKKILTLRGLPPAPWKARVSFGLDAVSRMP